MNGGKNETLSIHTYCTLTFTNNVHATATKYKSKFNRKYFSAINSKNLNELRVQVYYSSTFTVQYNTVLYSVVQLFNCIFEITSI